MLFLVFDSGYFLYRHDFWHVILVYSSAFALYFYVLKRQKNNGEIDYWLRLSVILRGGLLFSVPRLSEDIYRFIWDGRLVFLGINPFNFKPSYFIEQQLYTDVLTPTLFSQLNSPNYYSVYPSVLTYIISLVRNAYLIFKTINSATCIYSSGQFTPQIKSPTHKLKHSTVNYHLS